MRMLHLAICHDDRNEAMRTEAGDFLNKGNGKFWSIGSIRKETASINAPPLRIAVWAVWNLVSLKKPIGIVSGSSISLSRTPPTPKTTLFQLPILTPHPWVKGDPSLQNHQSYTVESQIHRDQISIGHFSATFRVSFFKLWFVDGSRLQALHRNPVLFWGQEKYVDIYIYIIYIYLCIVLVGQMLTYDINRYNQWY